MTEYLNNSLRDAGDFISAHRVAGSVAVSIRQAADMKLLFPEKVASMGLDKTFWWKDATRSLKITRQSNAHRANPFFNADLAMRLKILFPERTAELDIDEDAWQKINKSLASLRKWKDWRNFFQEAVNAKVLFPGKAAELNLDDQAWQEMTKGIERCRQLNDYRSVAEYAKYAKILFPEKGAELELNKEDWQKINQLLVRYREEKDGDDYREFTFLASMMKLLAAQKVEITDQGIECTMRPAGRAKKEKSPAKKAKR